MAWENPTLKHSEGGVESSIHGLPISRGSQSQRSSALAPHSPTLSFKTLHMFFAMKTVEKPNPLVSTVCGKGVAGIHALGSRSQKNYGESFYSVPVPFIWTQNSTNWMSCNESDLHEKKNTGCWLTLQWPAIIGIKRMTRSFIAWYWRVVG